MDPGPLNIVEYPQSNLLDIPTQLRSLADAIENERHGKVAAVFLIMPQYNDFPKLFGWGDVEGKNDPIIQLSLAKHWLLTNLVLR